ncbi:MAG TPA: hypothetical protein VF331_15345 [Polyangiales bacterium]
MLGFRAALRHLPIALVVVLVLITGLACSSPAQHASDLSDPQGQDSGRRGADASGDAGGRGSVGRPCTPNKAPNDEFYIACADAGVAAGDAATGLPPTTDSGSDPLPGRDAGSAPDAMVAPPLTPDEGMCAMRDTGCASGGHGATTVGTAVCNILGNSLLVQHEVCEKCGQTTQIADISLVIMDCGGCSQVYREGGQSFASPTPPYGCAMHTGSASLFWTAADPRCVDVYVYSGSGVPQTGGWALASSDQARVCRCNRVTNTCVTCVNGACDAPP